MQSKPWSDAAAALLRIAAVVGQDPCAAGLDDLIAQERQRIAREDFDDLVAPALAAMAAHTELRAGEADVEALRRIARAFLVTRRIPDVLADLCREAGTLVGAESVVLARTSREGVEIAVAAWSASGSPVPTGGSVQAAAGQRVPIVVESARWGTLLVRGADGQRDADASRLVPFAEFVQVIVTEILTRARELKPRARTLAALDDERRRIERNIHDGLQQRLIALALDLRTLAAVLPEALPDLRRRVDRLRDEMHATVEDVRRVSRGAQVALLERTGLGAALRALVRESPIPVNLAVDVEPRAPEAVELTVYRAVADAFVNAVEHSGAELIEISVTRDGDVIRAVIWDNGRGGARLVGQPELTAIADRVRIFGGTSTLDSPPGGPTRLALELPVDPMWV